MLAVVIPPEAQPCAAIEIAPEIDPAAPPRTRATALRCSAADRPNSLLTR
ncbi:hypothetical protein GCM10027088_16570 [Nocardia goodfellowii]